MISKRRAPIKPIKRTLAHRLKQAEESIDGLTLRLQNQEQAHADHVSFIHKKLAELHENTFRFHGRLVTLENGMRPKVGIDYYPTKRDLHVLRERVSGLSHREIEQALTQMLDRWVEIHG